MVKVTRAAVALAAATTLLQNAPADAIHLSEKYFTNAGGSLSNQSGTFWKVYEPLFRSSFSAPFNSMLKLKGGGELCSCTLLGEENGKYVVLTSAHCLGNDGRTGSGRASGSWDGYVLDFYQKSIGSGGTYYVPEERYSGKSDLPSWGTDIAIIKINKTGTGRSRNGAAVTSSQVYAGDKEVGMRVKFGGHGSWGVGTANEGSWEPPSSATDAYRRAHGDGKVGSLQNRASLSLPYTAKDGTGNSTWAQYGPGDSGGPTYGAACRGWALIGANQSFTSLHSLTTRASYYLDSFIKKVYPGVKTCT